MIENKYMIDGAVIENMARSLEYAAHALHGIASYVQRVQDKADSLEYELELKKESARNAVEEK